MTTPSRIRCRPIETADVPAIAALLRRGFPVRPLDYWTRGLDRLGRRAVPEGYPRYGYLLEHEGAPVGAILLIAQEITHDGDPYVRCNLASWYVEPAYRSHAAMLSLMPLRFKAATLLNISAAPNTWPTIQAQGFRRYLDGQALTLPMLGRGGRGATLRRYQTGDAPDLPEARLLDDHVANGCLAFLATDAAGTAPLVFLPLRARQGRFPFPGVQLIFCRDLADLSRFARPLGRALALQGRPFVLADVEGGKVPGQLVRRESRRYVRGARSPRPGDLAYTEFTIFGP